MFEKYSKILPKITWEEMPWSINNVYLCHDNQAEDALYKRFDLANNGLLEKVAKGNIANKEVYDEEKYLVLSQLQADRTKASSYFQAANVGSVVRYQGSECREDQKCYFIVRPGSKVTNREFYTAVTRCWDIKSFVIVIYKEKHKKELTEFAGCKIKKPFYFRVDEDVKLNENGTIPKETVIRAIKGQDTDDVAYRADGLSVNGKIIRTTLPGKRTKFSAMKILRDSPELYYSGIDEMYRAMDKVYVRKFQSANVHAKSEGKSKKDYEYQEDLFSAYPHFMEYAKMPVDGEVYNYERPDKLNYYVVDDNTQALFPNDIIVTDNLKNFVEQNMEDADIHFTFLFSTDYSIGHKASKEILKAAYDTKQSKKSTKNIRWGFFQRPYIKLDEVNDVRRAVRNSENVYEPLFCQIISEMVYVQLVLRKKIYGNIFKGGYMCVDAFFYDGDHTDDVKQVLDEDLKEYHLDYRIYQNEEVIYRSYEEPLSKDQKYRRNKKK